MRSSRALSSVGTLALLLGLCAATSTAPAGAVVEAPTPHVAASDVTAPDVTAPDVTAPDVTAPDVTAPDVTAPDVTGAEAAERLLRADATDPVTVRTGSDGVADFVGTLGEPVAVPAVASTATPVQAATEHLDRYGALFGVDEPDVQLEPTGVVGTGGGSRAVRFGQQVDGLPVIGGELMVSVDPDGDLESVNGETTEADVAVPAPTERAAAAVRTAVRTTARTHGVRAATLTATPATRWFYDPELVGAPDPLGARPVWRVEVSNGVQVRELVLVDTATGRVAAHVNQVAHLDRVVCDRNNVPGQFTPCRAGQYVRTETSAPNAQRAEANAAFDHAGDTAALYRRLGVDLTRLIGHDAGDGKKLRSTVNFCFALERCPWPNAAWNGIGMYYGKGFARADDVVAHELTHGVIEHTSNLFYWYQSGAINESMADVFGELVDQRNGTDRADRTQRLWEIGEDAPGRTIRDMANPGRFDQPAQMRSGRYVADRLVRDLGGVHANSGVGNKAAFLIAQGGTYNGRTVRGIDRNQADRTKTARIYFRTLRMLTSGSDYADLGRVLPQACRGLVGTGTPRITASDCDQVRRAVLATEMHLQPAQAAAPEAPRCTPRNARSSRIFFDNMERATKRAWSFGRLWKRVPRPRLQPMVSPYATSGRRSLFGWNPDPRLGDPANSSLTLRRALRVPARGRTFVRFDHAYFFEYNGRAGRRAVYFDGGRVEYSTDRGRTWSNAAPLRWVNGPRRQVTLGPRRPDFRGFAGDSHGYQSSRLDLSRFGGRTVRLRWTVSGDPTVGFIGWWLDDVDVYTCRPRAR